jgi:hypothetical protein
MTSVPLDACWPRLRGELDWTPLLSERQAQAVGRDLARYDWDFDPAWVFPDGLRMVTQGRDHHWRHPMLTLREVLTCLRAEGVEHVSGWWLPLGHRCLECPERARRIAEGDLAADAVCTVGDLDACYPTPRPEDRWELGLANLGFCPTCSGTGTVPRLSRTGRARDRRQRCAVCGGSGYV